MKKLYILFSAALFGAAMHANAQFSVTYKVDITEYLATETLGANGIRIGGNFSTAGSSLPDWSPSNEACGLTDEGNNIWSITVEYPASSAGTEQLFKFVNNDWGTNEGSAGSEIASGGCGEDDGSGNINRKITLPDADITYLYCWEKCAQCDGSSPILSIRNVTPVNRVTVFPNPVSDVATVNYTLSAMETVSMEVINALGQQVAVINPGKQNPGAYAERINVGQFEQGVYFVRLLTGNENVSVYRLNVVK